jgi:hypothetical protein
MLSLICFLLIIGHVALLKIKSINNMNPNLHTFKSRLLGTLILFIGASMQAQDTTYTWVSSDANPYHISGTIVLDSPSGSVDYYTGEPSLNDFLSYSITDPYANYVGDAEHFFPFGGGSITWNDTSITSIRSGFPGDGDLVVTAGGIGDYYGPDSPLDDAGSWVNLSAIVPDGDPNTIFLFVMTAFPLLGVSSLFKSRSASKMAVTVTAEEGVSRSTILQREFAGRPGCGSCS